MIRLPLVACAKSISELASKTRRDNLIYALLVTTFDDELLPLLDERGQPLRRRDGRSFVVII